MVTTAKMSGLNFQAAAREKMGFLRVQYFLIKSANQQATSPSTTADS